MTRRTGIKNVLALFLAVNLLAACESDEEKAERYFQSGLALLQAGDPDRALVELRNVFKHDGFHRDARKLYADTLMEQGKVSQAVSQYLRLIEQYPDTLEARHILAETAIFSGDWEEARRHGEAATALDPDHERSRALDLVLAYRETILDREEERHTEIATRARQMLDSGSSSVLLTLTVVDHLGRSGKPNDAMPYIDAALQTAPDQYDLHLRKFRLLSNGDDTRAVGDQLRLMAELFPDDSNTADLLIAWYISENDVDGAEAFLRSRTQIEGAGTTEQTTLVQFLLDQRGPDVALAELDRMIAASDDSATRAVFQHLSARVDLDQGRNDAAKERLRRLIEDDGYAPHEKAPAQVLLAQVLDREGNRAKARELVQSILEQSPDHAAALKLRATWHIDDSDMDAAIVDLRTALSQNPRDPEALALMARAHERQGDTDLAGERLALAVEVSNEAPTEALLYAAFLVERGRLKVASTVLRSSATRNPGNLDVLAALANVYLRQQDWVRAQDIAQELRGLDTPEAIRVARYLQAAILTGQNRIEESLSLLQNQIAVSSGNAETFRATVLIVQNMLQSDRLDGALTFTREQIAAFPDSLELQLLEGNLLALQGDMQAAEGIYRKLIAAAPQSDVPVRLLLTVLFATDRAEDARALLDESLERMPDSVELNWAKATVLERSGDLAGAAGIYEEIYRRDTSNIIAANNYASLIVTQNDDPETVEQAYRIAQRLRDANVPQFQDTYGWILHLRGESSDALMHLQTALAGLPDDPLVNYHIGAVYAALGRTDAAREQLARAITLYDGSTTKPAQDARALLDSLP